MPDHPDLPEEAVDHAVRELVYHRTQGRSGSGYMPNGELARYSSEAKRHLDEVLKALGPAILQARDAEVERKQLIRPGEEFEAARDMLARRIGDEHGHLATDFLYDAMKAAEDVRYRDVKPKPVVDSPEA